MVGYAWFTNSLFNTALKQSTSLRRDISSLSPPESQPLTPSLLGQISSSLTSFSRTIDSYASLQSSELNPAKKEKAYERLTTFRSELQEYRSQFAALKKQNEDNQTQIDRGELLGRRPHHASTPENPYANTSSAAAARDSPWKREGGPGSGQLGMNSGDYTRETHALREQNFFQNTHSALDEYLARGQAVLGDLGQQREMLKGTQKRLYSVANTLGVSGDTIRMIERRAKQDKWIFGAGVVVFFVFCWAVLHFFG
ncbi:transport BOS1 protein [Rutstroemia sp. NJR-2017a WRK4]|nr:transport BOS1 protein [Rutstroemia sp. NJR-2017a WRK4]